MARFLMVTLCAMALAEGISGTPLWLRPPQENPEPVKHRSLEEYKLPDSLVPSEYHIQLIPYMEETPAPKNFTFDGHVKILFSVASGTSLIRLHANDMQILEPVRVMDADTGAEVAVTGVSRTEPDDDRHFLDITVDQELPEGSNFTLDIDFVGRLNDDMEGFYRSNYMENGVEKWMLVTQFEQTYARRAFPCFDEPALKAVFKLSIARQTTWIALSNMDVQNESAVNVTGIEDWIWVNFKPSVVMSPYLLAFSLARFGSMTNQEDKRFKVWARPEYLPAGEYANSVAPKVVYFMEDFTGHNYPLPKMDEIAVPDFAAGAMENWGLITYRETALLYDDQIRTTSDKQGTASVVAHELAHQWFGNLVSPKWWSNTWLNEGFATFFASYAASHVETDWSLDEQFLTGDVLTAMNTDGQESAHPLVDTTVDSPSAASAVFDSISYSKGGSVIRMMLNFMGEENFKKGIEAYLEEMQYKSADQDDLWRGLSQGVPPGLLPDGVDLKTIMDTWALQAGVPVVKLERDYANNKATVTQKRFFTLPNENTHDEKYWIPLTVVKAGEVVDDKITWLYDQDLTLDMPAEDQWVLLNYNKTGYYRVNYDKENWRLMSTGINSSMSIGDMGYMNRAQLMFDSFALARAKELDYATAFDTTNYLMFENEFTPWNAVLGHFSYINDRFAADPTAKQLFQRYLTSRMEHLYDVVEGFNVTESDGHVRRLQRNTVLSWLCSMGDETCNQDGYNIFTEWRTGNLSMPNPISPDLRDLVYKSGMRKGGQVEYDFLYGQYQEAAWPMDVSLILSALGASKDTAMLNKLLADSIAEDSPFKTSEARSILSAVQSNPVGTDVALDFITRNFFNAEKQWGTTGSVFTSIAGRLNTAEHRRKVQAFLDTNTDKLTATAVSNLNSALASLDRTLQWHEAHRQEIVNYLAAMMGNSASLALITNLLLVLPLIVKIFV